MNTCVIASAFVNEIQIDGNQRKYISHNIMTYISLLNYRNDNIMMIINIATILIIIINILPSLPL